MSARVALLEEQLRTQDDKVGSLEAQLRAQRNTNATLGDKVGSLEEQLRAHGWKESDEEATVEEESPPPLMLH